MGDLVRWSKKNPDKGCLECFDFEDMWADRTRDERKKLISLLQQFDICFKTIDSLSGLDVYVIPMLLPKNNVANQLKAWHDAVTKMPGIGYHTYTTVSFPLLLLLKLFCRYCRETFLTTNWSGRMPLPMTMTVQLICRVCTISMSFLRFWLLGLSADSTRRFNTKTVFGETVPLFMTMNDSLLGFCC